MRAEGLAVLPSLLALPIIEFPLSFYQTYVLILSNARLNFASSEHILPQVLSG